MLLSLWFQQTALLFHFKGLWEEFKRGRRGEVVFSQLEFPQKKLTVTWKNVLQIRRWCQNPISFAFLCCFSTWIWFGSALSLNFELGLLWFGFSFSLLYHILLISFFFNYFRLFLFEDHPLLVFIFSFWICFISSFLHFYFNKKGSLKLIFFYMISMFPSPNWLNNTKMVVVIWWWLWLAYAKFCWRRICMVRNFVFFIMMMCDESRSQLTLCRIWVLVRISFFFLFIRTYSFNVNTSMWLYFLRYLKRRVLFAFIQ